MASQPLFLCSTPAETVITQVDTSYNCRRAATRVSTLAGVEHKQQHLNPADTFTRINGTKTRGEEKRGQRGDVARGTSLLAVLGFDVRKFDRLGLRAKLSNPNLPGIFSRPQTVTHANRCSGGDRRPRGKRKRPEAQRRTGHSETREKPDSSLDKERSEEEREVTKKNPSSRSTVILGVNLDAARG